MMLQGWVRSALYALCLLALIHPASTAAQTAADYRKQATEFAQAKAWDDAIENYRDALALEPNDAITHYDLALALKYQGSTKEALKEFQEAVQLKPKWADAHYGLGAVWYDLQDPDAALKEVRIAAALDPGQHRHPPVVRAHSLAAEQSRGCRERIKAGPQVEAVSGNPLGTRRSRRANGQLTRRYCRVSSGDTV